jgi:hypothetical protein
LLLLWWLLLLLLLPLLRLLRLGGWWGSRLWLVPGSIRSLLGLLAPEGRQVVAQCCKREG